MSPACSSPTNSRPARTTRQSQSRIDLASNKFHPYTTPSSASPCSNGSLPCFKSSPGPPSAKKFGSDQPPPKGPNAPLDPQTFTFDLIPGPFHPRPIDRRGRPYSEENPTTLYDGYSSYHGDGIIDFRAPLESQPPDILAYFILVDRLREAHYTITKEELFQMPVSVEEARSGAAFMERQRQLNQGVFVDRNAWIVRTPVDPAQIPIWTHTLTQVREPDDEKVVRGADPMYFGDVYVGPAWYDMMFMTNIQAMYPSYIVPIDWKTLLKMTFQLYRPMFHPITVWAFERSTEPFEIEAYTYDAVYCIGNLIIGDLVPEDVQREMMVGPDIDDEEADDGSFSTEREAGWSREEYNG